MIRTEPSPTPTPPAQPAAAVALPQPSYETVLISPQAPTWPRSIARFFQQVWDFLIGLFRKKTPPPKEEFQPTPRVIQTVHQSELEKQQKQIQMLTRVTTGIPLALFSYFCWRDGVLSTFQNALVNAAPNIALLSSAKAINRCARFVLPNSSPHLLKGASLAIAAPVIWQAAEYLVRAEYLKHPLGQSFAWITALQILNCGYQAYQEAQQQKSQRIQARVAQA
ncbi:MAG: hypothetical protein K1000chlam2_01074 [Chlamydiae bacterium]|nr:hypothetical protein [Chlamydiota bacterium]